MKLGQRLARGKAINYTAPVTDAELSMVSRSWREAQQRGGGCLR